MPGLPEQLVTAAAAAISGSVEENYHVARAAILGFLHALPEHTILTWPVPVGITLESWAESTAVDLANRIEQGGTDVRH